MKKFLATLDQPLQAKSGKEKALTVLSVIGFILLLYLVAFSPFMFRLFMTCLGVGVSLYVIKKIQDFDILLRGEEIKTDSSSRVSNDDQLSFSLAKPIEEVESSEEAEKERELERINSDKTLLFEELLSKADLDELEKETYRNRMQQKETESNRIKQDILQFKNRIQKAVSDKKSLFIKETPDMKLVAELIGIESVESSSFIQLNEELKMVYNDIPEAKRDTLLEYEMVNEDFELTRFGYKELMKEVRKLEKRTKQVAEQ
ncbi:hypothetical protein [Pseudalkalibacillus hwajinpoensis]|uniref:Uncharacterized protein n=1 Tax=Guptibacillus hwajinpoensis TaxID=208199 RepID=A0A4U1MPA4_9BACL|nr:hypothetical protein [Pseudalkalibacillus hwajinpoensis]TKD72545.1 hypothetical protein FBF83_07150 [Pseudalkalibacillus hwajinpoensis]